MANEDIWDSWEDFADSQDIDKHLEQGLNNANNSQVKSKDKNKKVKKINEISKISSNQDRKNPSPQQAIRILQRPPVVHEEDQNRTPFTPQLKILKRPEKSSEEQRNAELRKGSGAQQPVRTLAQREAAYAEARQRIMGGENHTNDAHPKSNDSDTRQENLKRYSRQTKVHQNGFSAATAEVKRQPKGPGNGRGFKNGR